MPPIQQCLWFIEQRHSDRWRVAVTNWTAFVDTVGADVLADFARCFLHADRLMSLATMVYLSKERHGDGSSAFQRDLFTMVLLSAGEVREFSVATKDLRAELHKRDLLTNDDGGWEKLREMEKRWDTQAFKVARNKLAFHVDPGVIQTGIKAAREHNEADLFRADGSKQRTVVASFAILSGIAGAFPDQSGEFDNDKYRQFLRSLAKDYQELTPILYDLFLDTLGRLGFEILRMRE